MLRERQSTTVVKKIITIFICTFMILISLWRHWFSFFDYEGILKDYEIIYGFLWITFHILGTIIVLRLYTRPMNISYKLSWTIFILTVPFLGTVIYLFVGSGRKVPKKKMKKISDKLSSLIPKKDVLEKLKTADQLGYKLVCAIQTKTNLPVYKNTNVIFFSDTTLKNNDMLEEMKKAKKYIFMEYFIFSKGQLLDEIINILEDKGKEGIQIKILYDSLGSVRFFRKDTKNRLRKIDNLTLAGYEKASFNLNPVINYRDHRKMTIIDGKIVYCGGDNIADEYIHIKKPYGNWRDNSVRLEGEAVDTFLLLFASTWYMSTKKTLEIRDYKYNHEVKNVSFVMPFGDGPTNPEDPTYNLFLNMISSANNSVYISTPYLIIDQTFLQTLARAAKSGIDVKILTPGVPDKKIVYLMTRAHYGQLLEAGVKVYEYTGGFNHAKNIIIDNKYAYIGTTNVDYRSFFLHFECGVLFFNDHQVRVMNQDFIDTISVSHEILYSVWKNRKIRTKFTQFLLNIFSPMF